MSERYRRETAAILLVLLGLTSMPVRVLGFGMIPCGAFADAHASWHAEEEPASGPITVLTDPAQPNALPPSAVEMPPPSDSPPTEPPAVRGCASLIFCPTSA